MIAAFDVYYLEHSCAAAAVLFSEYSDVKPVAEYTKLLPKASDYIPGEFYRGELPAIISLLKQINQYLDEMIIDGYVMLGDKSGLGNYLFKYFGSKIPVIGVAKSSFKGFLGVEIYRGKSLRPLYITSAGINLQKASENIQKMHGFHRIPMLLKRVDFLAREEARQIF
jgi:deoxyinosine 3'endonuclease (endonuclease V)